MKSVTDAATVATTSSVSFGVLFGYVTQGLAFISLLLGIALTLARLWEWWQERKKKDSLTAIKNITETAQGLSEEMDDLFYLE